MTTIAIDENISFVCKTNWDTTCLPHPWYKAFRKAM